MVGKTADEVANKIVALNNGIAGQCFSSCTNPVTLESVDASVPSFDVRSDCTNQVFEIKIEKITSVKQCTKQHNKGNTIKATPAKFQQVLSTHMMLNLPIVRFNLTVLIIA